MPLRESPASPGGIRKAAEGVTTDPCWISLIKAVVIVNLVMVAFAYLTWLERKGLGRLQKPLRGPEPCGPVRAALQPIADLVKLIRKEAFLAVERDRDPIHPRARHLHVHGTRRVLGDPVGIGLAHLPLERHRRGRERSDLAAASSSRSAQSASTASSSAAGASESKFSLLGSMRTCGAARVVRGVARAQRARRRHPRALPLARRHRSPAGDDASPSSFRSSSGSSSSSSPASRRRAAPRSTFPRRSRSSSPATTPSTRACAGASSRRPSTST